MREPRRRGRTNVYLTNPHPMMRDSSGRAWPVQCMAPVPPVNRREIHELYGTRAARKPA